MYGPGFGQRADRRLETIAIDGIPDRIGQIVRNNLLDRINPRGAPDRPVYRLAVVLRGAREGLAVRADEQVTRYNYRLEATFALRDAETSAAVFDGRTFSIASYNVVQSEFANIGAQRDAEQRTAREVSDEIRNRLVLFLQQQGPSG